MDEQYCKQEWINFLAPYDKATLYELCCMADMYDECTKQEEKFRWWQSNSCDYRWEDCEAAYELLKETGYYYGIRQAWLKGMLT